MMVKGQQQWDCDGPTDSSKNLSTWMNEKYDKVNFQLTQFLLGHGCFRKSLQKFEQIDIAKRITRKQ